MVVVVTVGVGISVVLIVLVTVGVGLSVVVGVGSGHRNEIIKLELVYTRYIHYCRSGVLLFLPAIVGDGHDARSSWVYVEEWQC